MERLARRSISMTTGAIVGAKIDMWEQQANMTDCTATMADLVAHEIGHVLGLGDVDTDAACNGTIMGKNPSYVSTDQCTAVKDTWYTPSEEQEDNDNDMETCNALCIPRCELAWNAWFCPPGGESPILFDLNDDGFSLTSVERGVWFDLNANGRREKTAWVTEHGDDAFLARDRDGDGKIADGRELLGNATPLANGSKAANGFVALAEFALDFGGNGDGTLDARDRVWPTLLLWRDTNHDGVAASTELSTLLETGVTSIDLHYVTLKKTDEYGNIFRYRGKATVLDDKGRDRNTKIYDVFLVVDDTMTVTGH